MPSNIVTLEQLLVFLAGGVLMWLGGVLKEWFKTSTEKRRSQIDEKARLERKIRELQETVYALRAAMIRSGQWSLEDLQEFERKSGSSPSNNA